MQKIYPGGAGKISPLQGWHTVTKPENFRCPSSVLKLINIIRSEDDRLEQVRGRMIEKDGLLVPVEGSARLFVLPADDKRPERLRGVRQWLAKTNNDPHWEVDTDESDVRVLVLVHRMAASRLGFPTLHAALNDGADNSQKDGWLDGTSWVVRPFLTSLLPLVLSARAGKEFDVISNLRRNCPLLQADNLAGQKLASLLKQLDDDVTKLVEMLTAPATATIRDVLNFVRERNLIVIDDRFVSLLEAGDQVADDDDAAVAAFLACPASELWGYRTYIEYQSPYATQQGVKGAEFERVMVILDDEQSAHNQFSYGKYFGIHPLSDTDNDNIAAEKDSVIDRTRRLLYVCCSARSA